MGGDGKGRERGRGERSEAVGRRDDALRQALRASRVRRAKPRTRVMRRLASTCGLQVSGETSQEKEEEKEGEGGGDGNLVSVSSV